MKAFWIYTLMRIGLFLATGAVIWGIYAIFADTINLLWVILAAAVISSVVSWKLLAEPRARFAEDVDQRAHRAASKYEAMRSAEDEPDSRE